MGIDKNATVTISFYINTNERMNKYFKQKIANKYYSFKTIWQRHGLAAKPTCQARMKQQVGTEMITLCANDGRCVLYHRQ